MLAGTVTIACLFVGACDEDDEAVRRERPVAGAEDKQSPPSWLELGDETRPELWLASREAGHAVAPGDPDAETYKRLLGDASGRFNETPRMIANRTAQLETMLAERGIGEDARLLITGFIEQPVATGSRRDYGALCQHYFNLRSTGVDRRAALAVLGGSAPGSR